VTRAPAPRTTGPGAAPDAAAVLDAAGRLTGAWLALADATGRILWCGDAAQRETGLPAAAMVGRRLDDFGHALPTDRLQGAPGPGRRPAARLHVLDALPGGPLLVEVAAVPVFVGGAAEGMLLRLSPLRTPSERSPALDGVRAAMASDVCAVAVADADGGLLYANDRWAELAGGDVEEPRAVEEIPGALVRRALLGEEADGATVLVALDATARASLGVGPGGAGAAADEEAARFAAVFRDLLRFGIDPSVPPEAGQDAPAGGAPDAPRGGDGLEGLSSRQRDVLVQLAVGASNKEIARRLGISVSTVKLHVKAICQHLGAPNRVRAASIAAEMLPRTTSAAQADRRA